MKKAKNHKKDVSIVFRSDGISDEEWAARRERPTLVVCPCCKHGLVSLEEVRLWHRDEPPKAPDGAT
jgi:hypothetical protein